MRDETPRTQTLGKGPSALVDQLLARWCKDETCFEKPLRVVFLSFLCLTVAVLTFQNVITEYRTLSEPQDLIVRTTERLLMHQRTLGEQALDQAVSVVSADTDLQTAIRKRDPANIKAVADRVFAGKATDLNIAELTIYSADQKVIYRAQSNHSANRNAGSFQSELNSSRFREVDAIELGPNNEFVVSVFKPWLVDGTRIGYLKLAINIEQSLALASSAVNAQIFKAFEISDADDSSTVHYKVLGNLTPTGFNFEKVTSNGHFAGLSSFTIQDGKVFMVRDLPITVVSTDHDVKLLLVKDITSNIWGFAKGTLLSLMAGVGLALLAWTVVFRLLSRLQSSVQLTRSRLEAEVLENTRKLESSTKQLIEAQRIAHVGSWERDISSNEIVGSEEYYRIMKIPPDLPPNQVQKFLFSRIPGDERRKTLEAVNAAVKTCGEFDLEHPMAHDDGSIQYLHVRGYVLAGPDGKAAKLVGTIHDITDRCLAERRNHLLAHILESSLNEIYILDASTFQIEHANRCALTNLGYTLEELKSQKIGDIDLVYDPSTVRRHVALLLRGHRDSLSAESVHRRKDGSEYPVDLRVQILRDQDRDLLVAIANDVSERVQRENETREAKIRAERLAYFDPLTKLSNRAGCQRDAKERFARREKPAFLIHVDMDGFKRVNDTLGHLAGDQCLEETGRRLREVCRGLGTAYRWGGDEFVILAEGGTSDPNELCERARRIMRMPMEFNGHRFWPTVSMGLALCPDDGDDFETLLVNADLALYQSKENGKDRYTFFRPDMRTDSETEAQIELELKDAVKNDQFFLVFQPQVNLRSQSVTGIEALVRWQHPERGTVSPAEFLPVVEKSGLAPILGEIVIDKAFAAARSWIDQGIDFGRISVNVSPSHLSSGLLLDHFKAAMEKHDIGPEHITAEVLESVFLNDNRSGHLAALRELFELGVHIELDDFGTGYASLSHVSDLPINGLKIDRSFTRQMLQDAKKEVIVNQLIHLARSLNIGVVCEGVETDAQYDRLRMMGDFSIQGYLIARPMPFHQATDWMSEATDDLYFVI
ncbi:EAL domain-containing protein [Roseibium sp. FZY0029]|uniref:EAL domain-containing protein n=1 Tax=Roseibium sp. FZY0029 TaxID=3116647 RepID=UPI002ECEC9E5|nr:EAL domain-containing protein [Roseibium sp. FZY0029]